MDDVMNFFRETDNAFTIYVVEQRFAVGRGSDFFRSYKSKKNYIDSDRLIRNHISAILYVINKHVPKIGDLVKKCFSLGGTTPAIDVIDIISMLSQIFTVHEHQAAGPEVIDPIIIQEGKILQKYVNQLIALHKDSILRPAIIIILKDNDFDRAKEMLSLCPHGTNIKMIRNSGESEMHKVINCGVDDPEDFLDAFTTHCFSTCSNTNRNVLYNEDWSSNSLVRLLGPSILQIRTNLLYRDKTLTRPDIDSMIAQISQVRRNSSEKILIDSFEVMLRLFRVFVNDGGSYDIERARHLAELINNEILVSQVNKCAFFMTDISFEEKMALLDSAYDVFVKNSMEDQAIYCKNNRLVRQFDADRVDVYQFEKLEQEAINNVPGLVGMSHILNNTGLAHMLSGYPDIAISFFEKGLDYAYRPERCLQKVALLTNIAVANAYCYGTVDEQALRRILNTIFDNSELVNIPYITARYALNAISLAFSKSSSLGKELMQEYDVENLIHKGSKDNVLGADQMNLQIAIMQNRYDFQLNNNPFAKRPLSQNSSVRQRFIEKTGLTPFFFSTWF